MSRTLRRRTDPTRSVRITGCLAALGAMLLLVAVACGGGRHGTSSAMTGPATRGMAAAMASRGMVPHPDRQQLSNPTGSEIVAPPCALHCSQPAVPAALPQHSRGGARAQVALDRTATSLLVAMHGTRPKWATPTGSPPVSLTALGISRN